MARHSVHRFEPLVERVPEIVGKSKVFSRAIFKNPTSAYCNTRRFRWRCDERVQNYRVFRVELLILNAKISRRVTNKTLTTLSKPSETVDDDVLLNKSKMSYETNYEKYTYDANDVFFIFFFF